MLSSCRGVSAHAMRVPNPRMDSAHTRMKRGPSAYHQTSILRKRSTPINGVMIPVKRVKAPKKRRTPDMREDAADERRATPIVSLVAAAARSPSGF